MQYDPNVIMQFADKLYAKANWIVLKYTFFGILIGILVGPFTRFSTYITYNVLVPIAGFIGYLIGTISIILMLGTGYYLGWFNHAPNPEPISEKAENNSEERKNELKTLVTNKLGDFEINVIKNTAEDGDEYTLNLSVSGQNKLSIEVNPLFEPEIETVSGKPQQNCQSMIASTFSGGAHCCTTALICTVCPTSSEAIMVGLGHTEIEYMKWIDLNGDGTTEIKFNDWAFAYYSIDGLSLAFISSPYMDRLLVFEKGMWRVDHPGEFKTYYENLAKNAVTQLQQLKTQQTSDDFDITAEAIKIAYYKYMITANTQEIDTALQMNLPVSWQKVKNKVFSDVQNAVTTFNPLKKYVEGRFNNR